MSWPHQSVPPESSVWAAYLSPHGARLWLLASVPLVVINLLISWDMLCLVQFLIGQGQW